MKKNNYHSNYKLLENVKGGLVFGFCALFIIVLGLSVYAFIESEWSNPDELEAIPGDTLTAEAWNAILANQKALSGTLNTEIDELNIKISTLSGQIAVLNTSLNATTPQNAVMAFNLSSCPTGWKLADGNNETPNLNDRFIVGAGTSYALGAIGGSTTITGTVGNHTLTIAEMPNHNHSIGGILPLNGGTTKNTWYIDGGTRSVDANTVPITDFNGSNQPHNHSFSGGSNLPPYLALIYCVKE